MLKQLRTVAAVATLTVARDPAAPGSGSHPDTYVVQRGDTLWDISKRFLGKAWLWPEIWQANPQVENPHALYPGDVLSLAYLNKQVAIQPGPRQEPPLTGVPLSEVEPFLKDLHVVDRFDHLPQVVGLDEDRLRSTTGQRVYVRGLDTAQPGQAYAVVRPGQRFVRARGGDGFVTGRNDLNFRGSNDPRNTLSYWNTPGAGNGQGGSGEFLGYELARVAVAEVVQGSAPPSRVAILALVDEGHEVRIGDRVMPLPVNPYDLQFFPHAPRQDAPYLQLQVLAVADAWTSGGPRDVVALSGGSADGIDNGTVFSIWRQGSHVADRTRHPTSSRIAETKRNGAGRIRMPDEYVGHVMVFRTFDHVSYGLVMEGVDRVRVGYPLKHPDATY